MQNFIFCSVYIGKCKQVVCNAKKIEEVFLNSKGKKQSWTKSFNLNTF